MVDSADTHKHMSVKKLMPITSEWIRNINSWKPHRV